MSLFKKLTPITALLLSACSTTSVTQYISEPKLDRDMYLRGVFSWWEADDSYKLIKQPDGSYMASIELIADGQPYDFKVADANWSQGFNCGFLNKNKDEIIQLNRKVKANCNTTANNFKFTPQQTATYKFYVDFSNLNQPVLTVTL